MVIIGGYTRLTNSGLSIVEWQLFKGVLPPFNENSWQKLFVLYQQIPQFKEVNFYMQLEDFKQIFWLEYIHRLIGRILGLITLIPAIYFLYQAKENEFIKEQRGNICIIVILLLAQGVIGFVMVASGLSERVSVDHLRLAFHLLLAFTLFAFIFINYVKIKYGILKIIIKKNIYYLFIFFMFLLLMQIIYGAFVAGLKAGLIYNSFPMMGDNIYPFELKDSNLYSFINNPAITQFMHRILASLLLFFSLVILFLLRCEDRELLFIKKIISFLLVFQYILGVTTLITKVNIHIAIIHQFTALWLFAFVILFKQKINVSR